MRLAFTPDGRRLATEDGKAVKVWDLATGAESLVLPPGSAGRTTCGALAPGAPYASKFFDKYTRAREYRDMGHVQASDT